MSEPPLDAHRIRALEARRGLFFYFALVVLGSGACEGAMIAKGGAITDHIGLALLNMWVPGIAAIVIRLVRREGFRDVSFALRGAHGFRMLALAWLAPVVIGGVAYSLAWSTGLETFAVPAGGRFHMTAPPVVKLLTSIALNLTLGTVLSAISAAGEEIGWRGYMLTRLVDAKVPHPLVVSGLVWSAWHLPMIVAGIYAAGPNPFLSAALFTIGTTAGGLVAARVRLESGSVWPAIAFHSSWNAVIQGSFDRYTKGGDVAHTTVTWTGESGWLVIATSVVFAGFVLARAFPARREPRGDVIGTFDWKNA